MQRDRTVNGNLRVRAIAQYDGPMPSAPDALQRLDSPLGPLTVVVTTDDAGRERLSRLEFDAAPHATRLRRPPCAPRRTTLHDEIERQLGAYFAGVAREFDLPLAPAGTAFQRRVWDALCRVPFGATISYGALARSLGATGAQRAVGAANGANPIPIVIPCHRVIASDGTLHGYGGGLHRKEWLLRHEGALRIEETLDTPPAQPARTR